MSEAKVLGEDRSPGPWVVSPVYDQWFLLGAWLFPFGLLLLVALLEPTMGRLGAVASAYLVFQFVDCAHIFITWPILFGDRGIRARYGDSNLIIFAGIVLASIACTYSGRTTQMVYWTSFLFFGTWHNIRQHYGFLRLYQARTPSLDRQAARAEVLCLYGGTATAFFTNIHFGWLYESFGANVTWIQVPALVPCACFVVFLYGLIGALVGMWQRRRAGLPVGGPRLLHLFLVLSNFVLGLLVLTRGDLLLTVLFITSYHDLQYLPLVWHMGRRRYSSEQGAKENPLALLFRSGHFVYFLGALALGALIHVTAVGQLSFLNGLDFTAYALTDEPGLMNYVANGFIATSLAHFILDGRIWKFSEDPRLKDEFDLHRRSEGAASQGSGVGPAAG
ncbi:MAG: hypothetical protein CMH55_01790 [Myxococcales bacterium]|nr:hypothetical protein [Myxococcales bacterium]